MMVETNELASEPIKKRKRVVLSVKEKNDIVQRLYKGETVATLSREYNVGMSTIYDVKKNSAAIINYLLIDKGCERRKSMKKPANIQLENALLSWIEERKSVGENVTGPVLCEKALELNKLLSGDPNFKASSGWLNNFKFRHRIKEENLDEKFMRFKCVSPSDACGYHFLTSDGDLTIVKEPLKETKDNINDKIMEDANVSEEPQQYTQDQQEFEHIEMESIPSNSDAMTAFDVGLRWLSKQEENSPILLMLLQNLRDLAEKKITNNIKQEPY